MKNKKAIISVICVVAVIAILAGVYFTFRPTAQQGAKNVTISVVDDKGKTTEYKVSTDAEYLKQVMDEADGLTYGGADSEYGTMVDTVNGIRADYTLDGAYWSFYVNGEYCVNGIETQVVADGDSFAIEYTLAE